MTATIAASKAEKGQTFAIRVSDIGKQFRITARPRTTTLYDRASRIVTGGPRNAESKYEVVWALRDVSFDVEHGEILGIVGRNGAGKSTLLQILARITSPTEGEAITYGRVAALLSVGAGFHPDLSGRENIKLTGAILGMSREEIAAAEGPIIDFAEIGNYLDAPVKFYSSGMYLRLAFSVSINLAAEIMLIDEVLAVGDAAFQLKCQDRIQEAVGSGRTVIVVSHNTSTIEAMCRRAIVLDRGQMQFIGPAEDATKFYRSQILGLES
jgi:lipopolysaccharide transport system ATP-binding protein